MAWLLDDFTITCAIFLLPSSSLILILLAVLVRSSIRMLSTTDFDELVAVAIAICGFTLKLSIAAFFLSHALHRAMSASSRVLFLVVVSMFLVLL